MLGATAYCEVGATMFLLKWSWETDYSNHLSGWHVVGHAKESTTKRKLRSELQNLSSDNDAQNAVRIFARVSSDPKIRRVYDILG